MKEPLQIHFVTWPDGKLFEGTQTSIDPKFAINAALLTWLIPDWFPGVDLHPAYSPVRNGLWAAMERAGFRVQSIPVPDDVAKGVSR